MNLIEWLYREGYIFYHEMHYSSGEITRITITKKCMEILSINIESLDGKNLGDAMIDAAKDIGRDATKDVAKGQLANFFGQLIGGIIKNASGG
ncbi:hypothetical protein [Rhabdaerophilum sp.]|uniref:hypothetical protein n=1 Tax=Rhabdaerophilum sp. TaxID=2717341 RepID=UPI0038D45C90